MCATCRQQHLVYQVDHAVAGQDISRGHFAAVDEDAVAEDGDVVKDATLGRGEQNWNAFLPM